MLFTFSFSLCMSQSFLSGMHHSLGVETRSSKCNCENGTHMVTKMPSIWLQICRSLFARTLWNIFSSILTVHFSLSTVNCQLTIESCFKAMPSSTLSSMHPIFHRNGFDIHIFYNLSIEKYVSSFWWWVGDLLGEKNPSDASVARLHNHNDHFTESGIVFHFSTHFRLTSNEWKKETEVITAISMRQTTTQTNIIMYARSIFV